MLDDDAVIDGEATVVEGEVAADQASDAEQPQQPESDSEQDESTDEE